MLSEAPTLTLVGKVPEPFMRQLPNVKLKKGETVEGKLAEMITDIFESKILPAGEEAKPTMFNEKQPFEFCLSNGACVIEGEYHPSFDRRSSSKGLAKIDVKAAVPSLEPRSWQQKLFGDKPAEYKYHVNSFHYDNGTLSFQEAAEQSVGSIGWIFHGQVKEISQNLLNHTKRLSHSWVSELKIK